MRYFRFRPFLLSAFFCFTKFIFNPGKGPCDRKAAVIKGQVRRFVNEKNDCMNSADFVAAAKSTKNLSIFSCNFPAEKQNRKVKWEGVSKYNNIEFTQKRPSLSSTRTTALSTSSPLQIEIKTWRAFNIGSGKIFRFSDFKSTSTEIVPLEFEHGAQYIDKSWKCEKSSSSMFCHQHYKKKILFLEIVKKDFQTF